MLNLKTGYIAPFAFLALVSSALSAQQIGGRYRVVGTDLDGSKYSGTVDITISSDTDCRIVWHTEGEYLNGICLRGPDTFVAAYLGGAGVGLVLYTIEADGTLNGVWTVADQQGVGTDVLTPERRTSNPIDQGVQPQYSPSAAAASSTVESAKNADGSSLETKGDGTKITTNADGSSIETRRDGTVIVKNAGGSSEETRPDGTKIATNGDGSSIETHRDGTVIVKNAGGSSEETRPDGTKIATNADGSSIETRRDGTKIVRNLDGSLVQVNPDGSEVLLHK
jgi:hypothetical protein